MKTQVDERDATDVSWYCIEDGHFTPDLLEETFIHILKNTFAYDDAEVMSDIEFSPEEVTAKPRIVCSVGNLGVDQTKGGLVSTGYGKGINPGEDHNSNKYERILNGKMSFVAVADCAPEARDLGYNLLVYLLQLSYFIPEMMDLKSFLPMEMGKVTKVEDNENLWSCPIQCSYTVDCAWDTERLAPRLKTFNSIKLDFDSVVKYYH